MKKMITAIFLLFSVAIFAQERRVGEEKNDSNEMASLTARRMAMQLDLNKDQEDKLQKLYFKRIESRQESKDKNLKAREEIKEARADMREDRQETNEEMKADLKEILTAEQFQKWEQLQEKRKQGRKAPMRKRQN